jgi:hypothetical protein
MSLRGVKKGTKGRRDGGKRRNVEIRAAKKRRGDGGKRRNVQTSKRRDQSRDREGAASKRPRDGAGCPTPSRDGGRTWYLTKPRRGSEGRVRVKAVVFGSTLTPSPLPARERGSVATAPRGGRSRRADGDPVSYIGVHDPAPSTRTGSASDRPDAPALALGVRNAVAQSRTVIQVGYGCYFASGDAFISSAK